MGEKLLLKCGLGKTRVLAGMAVWASTAAVVDIALAGRLGVDLGDKRPAAEVAGELPGVSEGVMHRARAAGATEHLLNALELVHCHHRRVGAAIALA